MNKRKKILLITGGVLLVVIVISGLAASRHNGQDKPPAATESANAGTVVIDNTNGLNSILLPEQYQAVSNALAIYIQTKLDSNIDHAVIVGQPVVANDGSVSFKIKTSAPERQFDVTLDRSQFDKVIMAVPTYGYTQTIPIYSSAEGE